VTRDRSEDGARRVAVWALLGFAIVVAAVTFVLSFHGLDGYGRDVARVGERLSWLVPLGVDGLTLTAVAATFLLRNAAWRVRAYAWFVFVVANGASVAGNLSHGKSQHLSPDGMVGAAAWPLLLALASHLAIVTRRSLDKAEVADVAPAGPRTVVTPVQVSAPVAAADVAMSQTSPQPAAPVATPEPTATPTRQKPRPVAPKTPPAVTPVSDIGPEVRRMWQDGMSHTEIAAALLISKKTAERHTAELRQEATTAVVGHSPTPAPTDSDSRDMAPVA
jgi:hypothetical protein